jgi:hypothetical protein
MAYSVTNQSGYQKNFNQVYFRGTPNNWGTTSMSLVADNTWQVEATFGSSGTERFKFDINGDWTQNYGDNTPANGYVVQSGADIPIALPGTYTIVLNDSTMAYSVSESSIETASHTWGSYTATITVTNPSIDARGYSLGTNLPLRHFTKVWDMGNTYSISNPRNYSEVSGSIVIRTGNYLFDGLFALAMEEARENSVSQITDGSFNNGQPTACPTGGCFETGRDWTYVWTRDTSYSVNLALAMFDPTRARNSMEYKISRRRGNTGQLEIVQDTGSGGSWPVSTDRVTWAIGAMELLKYLDGTERANFLDKAYEAVVTTVENDRQSIYDHRDGLYKGEQSFLDWREQTYPIWTASDTAHLGMSKSVSTNIAHYVILKLASDLANEKGDTDEEIKYAGWASDLKDNINEKFWISSKGLYSGLINTEFDISTGNKFEMLGNALAIIYGVADSNQAAAIMANYPHTVSGPPVIWPQQPAVAIYHNRGIWPFVTAYTLRAARIAKNDEVIDHNVDSLMKGAALNLSNMENFEFLELANFKDTGNSEKGPQINSRRQLWSVAGYQSMVLDIVFGREATQTGIRFQPFITKKIRNTWFADVNEIELKNLPYRGNNINVKVLLPQVDLEENGYYTVDSVSLNGVSKDINSYFGTADLASNNNIEIQVVDAFAYTTNINIIEDTGDYRAFWAPVEPDLSGISIVNDKLQVSFNANGMSGVTFNIYRNGALAAEDVTSPWTDETTAGNYNSKTYCYAVESVYTVSGNASHHSKPQCHWGTGSIQTVDLTATNNKLIASPSAPTSTDHGRLHYMDWGDPGEELLLDFVPSKTGKFQIQIKYGNSMGPINTGITASVKKIEVWNENYTTRVDEGTVFMPHLANWSTWGDSSGFNLSQTLNQGTTYKVVIKDFYNMSYLQHFTIYKGMGGSSGRNNRANISGVKFLFIE